MGFQVVLSVSNGKALSDAIYNEVISPDICIIDVDMPIQDGKMTAMYIREYAPGIALMLMSMKDSTEIGTHAADCFTAKGEDLEILRVSILSLVAEKKRL